MIEILYTVGHIIIFNRRLCIPSVIIGNNHQLVIGCVIVSINVVFVITGPVYPSTCPVKVALRRKPSG